MSQQNVLTLMGLLSGVVLASVPRVVEAILGRRKDAADGSAALAEGAHSVTSAAMALLAAHEADTVAARAAEAKCRADLAAANARISETAGHVEECNARVSALEAEVTFLRSLHDDVAPE